MLKCTNEPWCSFVQDVLPKTTTKAVLSVLDKLEGKISGRGTVTAGKGFTLCISNEDMDDIIRIVKSLEDSCLLINCATESVKYETKTRRWVSQY